MISHTTGLPCNFFGFIPFFGVVAGAVGFIPIREIVGSFRDESVYVAGIIRLHQWVVEGKTIKLT